MGTWGYNWAASYCAIGSSYSSKQIITYKNTSSSTEKIKSITMNMGTGKGTYTYGDTVTGNGSAINFYVYANGNSSLSSSSVSVTNVVGVSTTSAGLAYPTQSQMKAYTVTFSKDVEVAAGSTVYFTAAFLAAGATGAVFVWNRSTITGTVETVAATPTYYTVTFNLNGGTRTGGGALSQSVASGGTATAPTCTKDGYIFNGWDKSLVNITANTTITAQWMQEEASTTYYTVRFQGGIGTYVGGGAVSQQIPEGGAVTNPPIFEADGYEFIGWDTDITYITENIWPIAQWQATEGEEEEPEIATYVVSFDLAGGTWTGGGALVQTVEEGESATPPTCSKTGYTFLGWSGSYTNIWEDTTIAAVWEQIVYTIAYYPNGGYGSVRYQEKPYGESVAILEDIFYNDAKLTYNANGGSVTPSYTTIDLPFKGWGVSAAAKYVTYTPGQLYTNNAGLKLYALWGSSTFGELPVPTMNRATFIGWYDAGHGGSQVNSSTVISNDTTIYAYWDYEVSYDMNGGEGVLPNETKYYDIGLTLTSLIPERKGYTFLGWSTNKNATSATYAAGGIYTTNAPATLYAVWQAGKFTVTFDLQGGTFVSGGGALVQTVSLGGSATLPKDPTHTEGKAFRGWSGQYRNVDSDRTIYARWLTSYIWIMNSSHKWEHLF